MRAKPSVDRRGFLTQGAALGAAMVAATQTHADAVIEPARKIRVGIIGCGSVSRKYLPNLSACPFVELVSTCDIIPQKAEKAAAQYKVPHHYPNIEAMLAGAPFDLMITLTDMQEHGRLNTLAVEAGRNVWSEKPLANSYAEGKALLELARAQGRAYLGSAGGRHQPAVRRDGPIAA